MEVAYFGLFVSNVIHQMYEKKVIKQTKCWFCLLFLIM